VTKLEKTAAAVCTVLACLLPVTAQAEVDLAENKGWTVYSDGRVNAFMSVGFGDGYPNAPGLVDGAGVNTNQADENNDYFGSRVRSGFLSNVLGFGLRRQVSEATTMKLYLGLWATIEPKGRLKYDPIEVDAREGYLKLEGPWGSFLAGRTLALFGRGSVEIDFLYGHGYGLGHPCDADSVGPTCGHIGFGVLFPGFAPGFVYTTPRLGGLALALGAYDPVALAGKWHRTPYPRPEAELSFEQPLGNSGKVYLFGAGVWQKLGKEDSAQTTEAMGVSYGGRLEYDIFRLGLHGFYGPGLGLYYALQNSPTNYRISSDTQADGELRTFDGYYAQLAVMPGDLHLAAGAGMARVHLLDSETAIDPATGAPYTDAYNVPKQQLGVSAAVYYHFTEHLVGGLDWFHAKTEWYHGDEQVLNFVNAGVTAHW
jgi:hypothetical protein